MLKYVKLYQIISQLRLRARREVPLNLGEPLTDAARPPPALSATKQGP